MARSSALLLILLATPAARATPTCPLSALPAGRTGTIDDYLAAALRAREHGDPATSLGCLSRAYTLEPSAGLLHNIARLFEDLGRYREAAEAYRRLGRTPGLDPALAAADAARLTALLPRLERAWIVATTTPGSEALAGDVRLRDGEEVAASPGTVLVETRTDDTLEVLRVELTAGVRRELVLPARNPTAATVVLAPGTRALTLDGRVLASSTETLAQLRLEPGGYLLTWVDASGEEQRAAIQLAVGSTWSASAWVEPSPLRDALPWIGAASGLTLAGAGAVFLGVAEADRSTIRDAHRDARGAIDGLTQAEAERLAGRADDRTAVGVGLLVGAAAALTTAAIVWWWTGPDDEVRAAP